MRATAVIPVKGLAGVKRRLSTRLWPEERAGLVLRLLAHELDVLNAVASIDQIIVVTPDSRVTALAEMRGAVVALQPDNGVNTAMRAGLERAFNSGAEKVLAIHGDLPFVEVSDIDTLVHASEPGVFVIAPDRRHRGTNAIVLRRDMDVELHFGIDSYALHTDAARAAGQRVQVITRSGLAFDLDTPTDLLAYRRRGYRRA